MNFDSFGTALALTLTRLSGSQAIRLGSWKAQKLGGLQTQGQLYSLIASKPVCVTEGAELCKT